MGGGHGVAVSRVDGDADRTVSLIRIIIRSGHRHRRGSAGSDGHRLRTRRRAEIAGLGDGDVDGERLGRGGYGGDGEHGVRALGDSAAAGGDDHLRGRVVVVGHGDSCSAVRCGDGVAVAGGHVGTDRPVGLVGFVVVGGDGHGGGATGSDGHGLRAHRGGVVADLRDGDADRQRLRGRGAGGDREPRGVALGDRFAGGDADLRRRRSVVVVGNARRGPVVGADHVVGLAGLEGGDDGAVVLVGRVVGGGDGEARRPGGGDGDGAPAALADGRVVAVLADPHRHLQRRRGRGVGGDREAGGAAF